MIRLDVIRLCLLSSGARSLWQMKSRLTSETMMKREKCVEGKGKLMTWSIPHLLSNNVEFVFLAWARMATSGTESLVFFDDVTADKSSRMNFDVHVYRAMLSVQIQSKGAELIGLCFTVQMIIFKNTLQKQPKASKGRWMKYSSGVKSVTSHQPHSSCFSLF